MTVKDILESVQAVGGVLRIDGGKLVLEADCGAIGQTLKEAIRAHKEEIIRVLSPPPTRSAVKNQKETLAKEQVSAIEAQALALGWERDQLDELGRCIKVYLPNCRIGEVRLNAIQVIHLYHDGTIRNYSNFYNMRTEQPWIKKVDRPPTG